MPEAGHNGGPPLDNQALTPEQIKQLRAAAEFIDGCLDDIAEKQGDIKASLEQAKALAGLKPATLRKAVMLRRKRKADPEAVQDAESLLELYEAALQ